MGPVPNPLPAAVATSLAERLNLRFPVLVIALAVVTVLDVLIPDLVPFVDEIGLALLTLVLSRWKARRTPPAR
jgi:hypothetical protein